MRDTALSLTYDCPCLKDIVLKYKFLFKMEMALQVGLLMCYGFLMFSYKVSKECSSLNQTIISGLIVQSSFSLYLRGDWSCIMPEGVLRVKQSSRVWELLSLF